MKQKECPFCKGTMEQQPNDEMMELLLPKSHALMKIAMAGMDRSRGKWYECMNCHYTALFRKDPREP